MLDMLNSFWQYWNYVFTLIGYGFWPRPQVYAALTEDIRAALPVALGVVFLSGISLLIGQSVILFLNRVPPIRFVISLLIQGVLLTAGLIMTAIVIWLSGLIVFRSDPEISAVITLTAVSYAPLAFGFLILIPYFGIFIEKLLYAWTLLILLFIIRFGFDTNFVAAVVCVGLAYGLRTVLSATIGRPLVALRNWILRRVIGTDQLAMTPDEIRAQVSAELLDSQRGEPGLLRSSGFCSPRCCCCWWQACSWHHLSRLAGTRAGLARPMPRCAGHSARRAFEDASRWGDTGDTQPPLPGLSLGRWRGFTREHPRRGIPFFKAARRVSVAYARGGRCLSLLGDEPGAHRPAHRSTHLAAHRAATAARPERQVGDADQFS
ncbi:hypothetical protein HC891_24585 [Candidatus Gracilibacteria bacterium]|nr:hypothetical protein [Candidatus Gracilibacteria bacterium]